MKKTFTSSKECGEKLKYLIDAYHQIYNISCIYVTANHERHVPVVVHMYRIVQKTDRIKLYSIW